MIEPLLLETARVAAGLTQGGLAKRLGKSQPFISQVERGERDVPPDLQEAWAEACEVPVSFFNHAEGLPPTSMSSAVHRRMATLPAKPFNRAIANVRLRCLEVDLLFAEVDVEPALQIPRLPAGIGPADAAAELRRQWLVPEGPLPNLVALVEGAGIPVLLSENFHDKHSGISHRGRWLEWLIVLNAGHSPSRHRFTLAHELGHIVLRHDTSAIVDDLDARRLEEEANAFASALLLPEEWARKELRSLTLRRLVELKQRWRVSMAFLIKRAGDLELVYDDEKKWLYMELSTQPGGRRREPGEFEREEPQLLRAVIGALQDDGLSIAEIADLMRATEESVRTEYLGEPSSLRAASDRPRRTHLRLARP